MMTQDTFYELLKNYQALISRIDIHILKVEKLFSEQIACKKGCDSCCKRLSLLPVEALSISHAFSKLPQDTQNQVITRLKTNKKDCPFLVDSACVLYPARPIICRTHGFPIFMENKGEVSIDFCPKNFKQITSFPKEVLLSVEQLNATLIAINSHLLESIESEESLPERLSIEQAIALLNEM